MDARIPLRSLALAAVLAGAGCIIGLDDGPGRPCTADSECPDSYGCVGSEDGEGTCEVLYPPRPSASADGADAGPVPTYCQDIQPILAANCVSTCHGAVNTNGTSGFRLDYYEPDGGGLPGARAKAERIKIRAVDSRSMPPPGNPAPTLAQRALLARWALAGAPACASDAGTPDGGSP